MAALPPRIMVCMVARYSNYEETFLYHEVSKDLFSHPFISSLLVLVRAGGAKATDYYKSKIFGESTFADMPRKMRPTLLLTLPTFTWFRCFHSQRYFDCLFRLEYLLPTSSSVTASSAFVSHLVLENKNDCDKSEHLQPSFEATSYRNEISSNRKDPTGNKDV
ncbi:hypothetical protein O9992_18655 [Vibrio lentus]|nr:hypothetical protein [Vibrio lentus]